ncbi:uncharacterized protein LOC132544195 [Ylistrum balloti]|uniref:uncharacterized protein LOC132544195 n=1 Tax=Ylistrum balloti TaxID=509963 RepID=UPI002905B934|nr:uncharacterized protein LOC132544195 [Ylistrum balloti]
MLWTSVILAVITAVVAQDFFSNRNYGDGAMPSSDHLFGSRRRVLDRTYQGTHITGGHRPHVQDRQYIDPIDSGFGQSRLKKVVHKPVVDTGYVAPKPINIKPKILGPGDLGYIEPGLFGPTKGKLIDPLHHAQIDTGYVKPKLVDPLDASYIPTKPHGPIDIGYVDPKIPVDTAYVKPKLNNRLGTDYLIDPLRHSKLDTSYVKPKLVDPLDATYVPTKPLGPSLVDTPYVEPKVVKPLGADYIGPKMPAPGDLGFIDPTPFGKPTKGKLTDPISGHGIGHKGPHIDPFFEERVRQPGISTSDFVAVETEDAAVPFVGGSALRDPSWVGSQGNPIVQSRFPEQRRLPSDIQLGAFAQRRNNLPFIPDISQEQQRILSRPSKPIPPPIKEKKIMKKKVGRTADEKRRYYQRLRNFDGSKNVEAPVI